MIQILLIIITLSHDKINVLTTKIILSLTTHIKVMLIRHFIKTIFV